MELSMNPDPEALTEILSSDEVEAARTAAQRFGGRDETRWTRARETFEK